MGVRPSRDVNPIEAEVIDGVVVYTIGSTVYKYKVETLKGKNFPKQCNMFLAKNIFAYFVGEKESVVLRFDGTGCIFTTGTNILIKSFVEEAPEYISMKQVNGGALLYSPFGCRWKREPVDAYLCGSSAVILTSTTAPFSAHADMRKVPLYMNDINLGISVAYPILRYDEDGLYAYDLQKSESRYKVDANVVVRSGFLVL